MPKLHPATALCVFFLYGRSIKTNEIIGPGGTGFIVERPTRWPDFSHYYGITNWHVARKLGASIIRINTDDGHSRDIELQPDEWEFIRERDAPDLAAADITDDLRKNTDKVSGNCLDMFADRDEIKRLSIGIGDDTFMLGLYAGHKEYDANEPFGRFGNISMLSTVAQQGNGNKVESHLVDTRSRGGFSGSPVFVYRTPANDLTHANSGNWNIKVKDNLFLRLLGVHSAQFPELVEVKDKKGGSEREMEIPSSVTVVVPAWEITRLLDLPYFEAQRMEREKRLGLYDQKAPKPEAASMDQESKDANPQHREDFTALLNEAAQKRPQDD